MLLSLSRVLLLGVSLSVLGSVCAAPIARDTSSSTALLREARAPLEASADGNVDADSISSFIIKRRTKPRRMRASTTRKTTAKKTKIIKGKTPPKKTTGRKKPKSARPTSTKCKRMEDNGSCAVFVPALGAEFEVKGKKGTLAKMLGETTNAEVWSLSKFNDQLNPEMVVKVFKSGFKSRETEALAAVGQLIVAGSAGGKNVIVMNEARGEILREILEREQRKGKTAVQSVLTDLWPKIAKEASRIAHSTGFYHNDLHAGNIFVDGDTITLIDWGLAVPRGDPNFIEDESEIMRQLKVTMDSSGPF